MSNRFITIAMISLALAACGEKPNLAPVTGGTPGSSQKVDPSRSVPKDSPAKPPTDNTKTILEGRWETDRVEGIIKVFTVKGNAMHFYIIDFNTGRYWGQDLEFKITENSNRLFWTHTVEYADDKDGTHQPEIFHLNENPASVVIGQSENDYQTYTKK